MASVASNNTLFNNVSHVNGSLDKAHQLRACVGMVYVVNHTAMTSEEVQELVSICLAALSMNRAMFVLGVVTGIPGNVLALLTILTLCKSTGTFYVSVLSVADLSTLVFKSTDALLRIFSANTSIGCKIIKFLVNFTSTYANWVLVLICFERLITIRFPLKKNYYFTIKRAHLSAVFMGLFLLPLYLVYFSYIEISDGVRCVSGEASVIWFYIFSFLYSYAPAILLFIMVSIIALEIKVIQRKREMMFGKSDSSQSNLITQQRLRLQAKIERSLSIMLLFASVVFVILTLPICVTLPLEAILSRSPHYSPLDNAKVSFAYHLSNNLAFLTHAVNFFIYFFSARRFRSHLFSLLRCWRPGNHGSCTLEQPATTTAEDVL